MRQLVRDLLRFACFSLLLVGALLCSTNSTYDATPPPPALEISQNDLKCLAENIYYEAGNQSELGMTAVAYVTINRYKHKRYPNTLCKVVYQRNETACQFSWTCSVPKRKEKEALQKARSVAIMVTHTFDREKDPTDGALYYHADYVSPPWKRSLQKTATIGRHLFYKERT